MVYHILKTIRDGWFTVDIDGINRALQVFLCQRETTRGLEVLHSVQGGAFGPEVRCDWATVEMQLRYSTVHDDAATFQQVHDFIVENSRTLLPSADHSAFLQALEKSVLRQELSITLNLFWTI